MEAIALIFTKFSEELIAAELAVLCFSGAIAFYWLVLRKKKKESADWVPAALVRQYLDRVREDERELRIKLFGEDSLAHVSPARHAAPAHQPLADALSGAAGPDPGLMKELDALRAQLSLADQRTMEFDRQVTGLRADKSALEAKLRDMPTGGVTVNTDAAALKQEVDDLKARLAEYEVIEDDLANLKKFQKENETLRAKLDAAEKGAPAPAAEAPAAAPVAAAPVVEEAPAVEESMPEAEALHGEMNTNVLQSVQPMVDDVPPPAAVSAEKSAKQKEEELLSEFEKMLAS